MRAGKLQRQPGGHETFIPTAPGQLEISLEPFVSLLSDADHALARLDAATEFLPNPDLFVKMYVRKEAVLSSQIEGTQASMNDLLDHEAGATPSERRDDVEEVGNYIDAVHYGIDRLDELPISVRMIREIHERILRGVRGQNRAPGQFREAQNWIGPAGCSIEEVTYIPPPANLVEDLLADMEWFIHKDEQFPVLIRAALVHQFFESVHPFWDGNGRVGRLLITLMLLDNGRLQKPTLYLSDYFKRHRAEYYETLQRIHDEDDLEGWIEFFLRGIRQVAEDGNETARQIQTLREEHRQLVASRLDNSPRALVMLEKLFERPVVTVSTVAELIDRSYPIANDMVEKFERLDLLVEVTGNQRNRRYHYKPYLDLFGELRP